MATLRFRLDDLVIDGVTLRRTRTGLLTLTWPVHAGSGRPIVSPADDAAGAAIEVAVLTALGFGGTPEP
jgi:hypothetical protein